MLLELDADKDEVINIVLDIDGVTLGVGEAILLYVVDKVTETKTECVVDRLEVADTDLLGEKDKVGGLECDNSVENVVVTVGDGGNVNESGRVSD